MNPTGSPGYLLDCASIPLDASRPSLSLRSSPPRRWGWPAAERRAGRRRPPRSSPHRRRPRARVARALHGQGAGPRLRRHGFCCHRERVVGEHLGREPIRRRVEDRRPAPRGRARVWGDVVPNRGSQGRRTAQQQPLTADTPGRHGLPAGAPGRAGARGRHGAGRCPRRARSRAGSG